MMRAVSRWIEPVEKVPLKEVGESELERLVGD